MLPLLEQQPAVCFFLLTRSTTKTIITAITTIGITIIRTSTVVVIAAAAFLGKVVGVVDWLVVSAATVVAVVSGATVSDS